MTTARWIIPLQVSIVIIYVIRYTLHMDAYLRYLVRSYLRWLREMRERCVSEGAEDNSLGLKFGFETERGFAEWSYYLLLIIVCHFLYDQERA